MKIELNQPLYQSALPVMEIIERAGHQVYFVGGCVRDTLLGHDIHDIDIASSATPDEIQALFRTTIDVGKEHGTVIVVFKGIPYEITTFRTEGVYSDFRRPDSVAFVRNLEEDTLRRDFTMNALAVNPSGELYDYHGGVADLQAKMIRAVGVATERFTEDALRILRAIRFASQLGFSIEAQTFQAIRQLAPMLKHISIERIRIEMSKFLIGKHIQQAIPIFIETGILEVLPLLEQLPQEQLREGLAQLQAQLISAVPHDEALRWALFLRACRIEEVESFLKKWTHSNQFIKTVQSILAVMDAYEKEAIDAWVVYQHDLAVLSLVQDYCQAHHWAYQPPLCALKQALPIQSKRDLAMNGKQLMEALGLKSGSSQVGEWLNTIEYQVVMGELDNSYDAIRALIHQ